MLRCRVFFLYHWPLSCQLMLGSGFPSTRTCRLMDWPSDTLQSCSSLTNTGHLDAPEGRQWDTLSCKWTNGGTEQLWCGGRTIDAQPPCCRGNVESLRSGELTPVRPVVQLRHSVHGENETSPVPSLLMSWTRPHWVPVSEPGYHGVSNRRDWKQRNLIRVNDFKQRCQFTSIKCYVFFFFTTSVT